MFSLYNPMLKFTPPPCDPPNPRRPCFVQPWIYTSESLSGKLVFVKNNFKDFFLCNFLCKNSPPLWSHYISWDNNLNKVKPKLHVDVSKQVSAFLVKLFYRRTFFKDFLHIIQCKNSSLHCGLSQPQGQ